VRRFLVAGPVAAVQLVIATLAASEPAVALGLVGGLAGLAIILVAPLVLLIAVFPGTFAYWRVGPASVDMSVTDALTILGILAALPFVPWRSPALRRILVATAAYAALLALTVVAHPVQRSAVEVAHQASLVAGAMLIGSAVAQLGQVRLALRVIVVSCGVVSLAAALDTLAHRLQPAYPFGIQKNAAGDLIVMGLVVLLTVPHRLAWRPWWIRAASLTLLVGLAASESRGAALALVAVFALHLMRQRRLGTVSRITRLAPLLIVASVGLIAISVLTYSDRDLNPTTEKFNAVNTRLDTYSYAIQQKWEPNLVFGAGLKWFFAPDSAYGVPHDLVIDELSEAGLVGMLGMLVLLWVIVAAMRRSSSDLGETGYLAVVAHILQASVDVFWVAGPGTLPFLIVGLVVGDEQQADADRPVRALAFAG
jgi:polysaccharide biosynthesis protein PslJ